MVQIPWDYRNSTDFLVQATKVPVAIKHMQHSLEKPSRPKEHSSPKYGIRIKGTFIRSQTRTPCEYSCPNTAARITRDPPAVDLDHGARARNQISVLPKTWPSLGFLVNHPMPKRTVIG